MEAHVPGETVAVTPVKVTNVVATADDKIITLSTCSTEGHRFVIHAKQVETVTF